MYDKKNLKGSGLNGKDDAAFLKVELSPWDHTSAPDTYQAQRFDDDSGHIRGSNHGDSNSHGLRNKLPDERVDYAHEGLSPLIDDSQPYNKLLAGGAPLTKGKGVGAGTPRYAPKTGPRTNSRG